MFSMFYGCPLMCDKCHLPFFHGGNTGSNPVSPTKQNTLNFKVFFVFLEKFWWVLYQFAIKALHIYLFIQPLSVRLFRAPGDASTL